MRRLPEESVVAALLAACEECVRECELQPRGVSMLLWGLARLGVDPGPRLMALLADEVDHSLHEFSPQNLSNTLWALERLGYPPSPALLQSVEEMEGEVAGWIERDLPQQEGSYRSLRLNDLVSSPWLDSGADP